MRLPLGAITRAVAILCALASSAWALDGSVPGIHGDVSRALLGDGTGAVIGIVDSGVDDTHPALVGRMNAEANFVTTEPSNTGDDVYGHGTWVASTALGNDPTYMGMAPDAHYINARVLTSSNGFASDAQVVNGIGFAIDQGADIINLSLNYFAPNNNGNSKLDLVVDWAAYDRRVSSSIAAGNISGTSQVRGPASAFNGITAGRTTADFSQVHSNSAEAYTGDGRMKPDVVAPGSSLTLANDDWETQGDWDSNLNGTSFAAPHVAGMLAQMLEAGATYSLNTDPLTLKANILNSADKVADKGGNSWQPGQQQLVSGVLTSTKPLDPHSGAGQIDGAQLSTQYLAGEQAPGLVNAVGWDFNSLTNGQWVDYVISPELMAGSTLSATLTWYRHVARTDDGDGVIDSGDHFFEIQDLNDLNLQILQDGNLVAESISSVDNVEHLYFPLADQAEYTLRVIGQSIVGGPEEFALAWFGTGAGTIFVPEPASLVLALLALVALVRRRRASR